MIVCGDTVRMYIRSCDVYQLTCSLYDNRNKDGYVNWEALAAFNLAMHLDYTLKGYLYGNGYQAPRMHQYVSLIDCCGRVGLKIPSKLRRVARTVCEYEGSSRYDVIFELDIDEYLEVREIVHESCEIIWGDFEQRACAELLSNYPPSTQATAKVGRLELHKSIDSFKIIKYKDIPEKEVNRYKQKLCYPASASVVVLCNAVPHIRSVL